MDEPGERRGCNKASWRLVDSRLCVCAQEGLRGWQCSINRVKVVMASEGERRRRGEEERGREGAACGVDPLVAYRCARYLEFHKVGSVGVAEQQALDDSKGEVEATTNVQVCEVGQSLHEDLDSFVSDHAARLQVDSLDGRTSVGDCCNGCIIYRVAPTQVNVLQARRALTYLQARSGGGCWVLGVW